MVNLLCDITTAAISKIITTTTVTTTTTFVCIEVLRPSQPNGVMSSAVG